MNIARNTRPATPGRRPNDLMLRVMKTPRASLITMQIREKENRQPEPEHEEVRKPDGAVAVQVHTRVEVRVRRPQPEFLVESLYHEPHLLYHYHDNIQY